MRVIIDIREQDLYVECMNVIANDSKIGFARLEKQQLDLGDILLTSDEGNPLVLIERKTFPDMMASIKDGRYKEQSHRLSHLEEYPPHSIFYLLEGGFHQLHTPLEKRIVYSSIASIQMFKGFSTYKTTSLRESAEWIISLANKLDSNMCKHIRPYFLTAAYNRTKDPNKGFDICDALPGMSEQPQEPQEPQTTSKDYVTVVKKVKKDNVCKDNIGEIMLSQIPGISANTAIGILKYFDSFPDMITRINNDSSILDTIQLESNGKQRKLGKNCIQNIKEYLLHNIDGMS
jgi:ERCC4-type nuclease